MLLDIQLMSLDRAMLVSLFLERLVCYHVYLIIVLKAY